MLLFYFYTGVSGGDHDEPAAGSLCNNFGVECNCDLDLICVYIGDDDENISGSLLKCHFDVDVIKLVVRFRTFSWCTQLCCNIWRGCVREAGFKRRKKNGGFILFVLSAA